MVVFKKNNIPTQSHRRKKEKKKIILMNAPFAI
jgi:hypothetical protein